MHRIIHTNAGSEPLDIPMGLGPYSHLSGDSPDVFFEASRPAFPDGLACPSQLKDKSISSALGPIVEFSRDIIRSNNLYTCFGNTILTSSFYSGLLLHPLCAALAIFNERREHQGIAKSIDWLPRDVNVMLQSPGIYRLVLGGVFLINMFEAHAAGNHLFGIIYGFASLGNLGAGRILNHTYFERLKSNSETDPDHKVPRNKASWSDTVTNPGINWCASDLLVGVMTLNARL